MKTINEYLEMAKTIKANYDKTVAEAKSKAEQLTADLAKAKNAASQALAAGDKATYTSAMQEADFLEKRLAIEEKTVVSPYKTAAEHNAFMNECRKAAHHESAPHYQKIVELIKQYTAEVAEIENICETFNIIARMMQGCGVPSGADGLSWHNFFKSIDGDVKRLMAKEKTTPVIHQIESFYIPKQPSNQD